LFGLFHFIKKRRKLVKDIQFFKYIHTLQVVRNKTTCSAMSVNQINKVIIDLLNY
jgi:hypothetical protein